MFKYFFQTIVLAFLAFSFNAKACPGNPGSVEKVVCLADSFKNTLTASQLTTLQLPYAYSSCQTWSNLPVTFQARLGLKFANLTTVQVNIVKLLLQEVSGKTINEGYDEMNQLWLADDYLAANGGGSSYGAGLYYICFIGTPTLTGAFEIQSGGHHLAIANTYNNGVMVGATPHFEATEPLTFTTGGNTYSPITQEKNALAAMFSGLTTTELATAKLSTTFTDILLGAKNNGSAKDWLFPTTKLGLRVGTLSPANKQLVMAAIKTYVLDIDSVNSTAILAQYLNQLDSTYIAYSGTSALNTKNDYVRIDGPGVWIEFTVQGGIIFSGVHYHSIWRDHKRDYGGTGSTNPIYVLPVGSDTLVSLPISIESTYVYKNTDNSVTIKWKTGYEINLNKFEIEYSTDGKSFSQIGSMVSRNSLQGNDYKFIHSNPIKGYNYYRLKSVDNDGKVQYSKVFSIVIDKKVSAAVYPNPASECLNIRQNLSGDKIALQLVSSSGKIVYNSSVSNNYVLQADIRNLPRGTYVAMINNGSESVNTTFIKQ